MRKIHLFLFVSMALICSCKGIPKQTNEWAIVLHGGAGGDKVSAMTDEEKASAKAMSEERQAAYEEALLKGIEIGSGMLRNGADAIDAVQAVVMYMEDCPMFNAGKGAVLTSACTHELDAAIMDGRDLNAGAVAGLKDIKNPILAAREVMENSPHVLLIGEGASAFAKSRGLESVDNSYFSTEKTAAECERIKKRNTEGKPMGTVGCVALDKKGNLAAATSTGGMSGKRWGRVGDVPIVGAGTYADNSSVAVSGTGHGELWIRQVVGHEISSLMKYKGMSVSEAAHNVIWEKIDPMEGSGGGIICVDRFGNIAMEYDTQRMFRAWETSSGEKEAKIYK